MASDIEASCENDPNFAVICAFFEKFGSQCGLPSVDFLELQGMIEDTDEVHPDLVNIFLKLLRRVKKTVKPDKWEKSLVAVCHNFSSQDAWEIERFGYKKAKLSSKVRILKELLEMQFDFHVKFKNEVNKLSANDLRSKPLGQDKAGHVYWFQSDENYQIRVYKEDSDEQTWTLIAKDREGLVSLINQLSNGENKLLVNAVIEERNSSEKPVIDTGQNGSIPKEKVSEEEGDSVSKTFLQKDEENIVETEHTIKTEEKPKPKLRIKNICELIDTSTKRPRFEDDSECRVKSLKINMNRIIVDKAIEEPVMRINEEGNGMENNDSPIVGEMIEEKVLYFHGEGSGFACQTGKEGDTSNEKDETCSDYKTDSINILVGSRDLDKNNCEKKLGDTDLESGNNSCHSSPSPNLVDLATENSEKHSEKLDSSIDHPIIGIKTPTEKTKKNFFFGSSILTTQSSLTVGFGESNQTKSDFMETKYDVDDQKKKIISKSCERNEGEIRSAKKLKSSTEDENSLSENIIEHDSNNSNKSEFSVGSSENEALENDHSSKIESAEIQSSSIHEKDSQDTVPVNEELCIKKVAYTCGKKASGHEIATESTINSSNNEKEITKITIGNEKTNTNFMLDEDDSVELKNSDQTVIDVKDDFKSDRSDETVVSNFSKIEEHPKEIFQECSEVKETVPKMSLRSVRSKKLLNVSVKHAEKSRSGSPSAEKSDKEKDVQTTEVVYVKGRRCRQKKDREVTLPIAATKKPKLVATTSQDKEGRTKRLTENVQDMKQKNGKDSVASPNSSLVSSPVSNTESVLTFAGSVDSNSLEPLEKDPLAESDHEETAPKPINLQSFSFDFNDSSTPPPIPVIPSTRLLRKRDRELSPALKSSADNQGKRRKVKGKRPVDTKLRKSIEQLKDQQVSSSDEDTSNVLDADSTKKFISRPKKKKSALLKKKASTISTSDDNSKSNAPLKSTKPVIKKKKNSEIVRHPENKNKRLLAGMDVTEIQMNTVRQSRRLAQMKIKEQVEQKTETTAKEEKKESKKDKSPKKTKKDIIILSSEPEQEPDETKKKKKKVKAPSKIFDEYRPWKSSSESSEEEGEEVEDEEEVIEEEPPLEFKSDHEFSPESDLNSADEYQPPKRARTARKKYDDDSMENKKEEEDFPCQKCSKSDHPEMILLCDKCDNGWHCSCLHPPLLSIPEGDWFCPPCQHNKLVENLHAALTEYDKKLTKKGIEDRRKERLAYVGISLNNVLPSREKEQRKNKRGHSADGESSSPGSESSVSESESSSDEPIYQLRQRRQARSYKFNEFDELIKSAIQDELNEKDEIAVHSRGKDMATIVKAEVDNQNTKELTDKEPKESLPGENTENTVETKHEKDDCVDQVIKPSVKLKKKNRKMCSLDLSSEEDDERDEDFKGSSSSSDEDDFEDESENSDESMLSGRRRKNSRPLRRSTRTRVSRFESNFIDDDDEDDDIPKKKKRAQYSSESDSSECDNSWRGRKKKVKSDSVKKRAHKKKKNSLLEELSDLEIVKKKKHRIKYGGLTSSDENMGRGRRTRGKRTTYVDTLGSDSDDAPKIRNSRKLNSDDDDDEDFVAFDEDEKDSEEAQDDQLEDDDEEENEGEVAKPDSPERRPLIVPKIYIKKPPVSKDFERTKERNIINEAKEVSVNNQNGTLHENEKLLGKNISNKDQGMNIGEKQIASEKIIESDQKKVQESESSHVSKSIEKVETPPKVEPAKQLIIPKLSNYSKDIDKDSGHSSRNQYVETNESLENQNIITNREQTLQVASMRTGTVKKEVLKEEEKKEPHVQISLKEKSPSVMKEKKPKTTLSLGDLNRKPIIDNVKNMIKNDDSNDELSEPPMGVALPLFEELCSKSLESPRKNKEKGRSKKTLEEAVADLGGKKKSQQDLSQGETFNIEIATPPLPFSQAAPTPSVITRMLQTKPSQTPVYPIGSIRPKQFATMPDDDDDTPSNRPSSIMDRPTLSGSPGQYMPGGSKGSSYRNMYINQYPRGMLPPHQIRPPPSTDIAPRQIHMMPSPRTLSPFINPNATSTPPSYYEGYPAESLSNEEDIPRAAYENPQYPESYNTQVNVDSSIPTESNNKHYGGEEPGGEFGGLVSYFSSQQEEDMES